MLQYCHPRIWKSFTFIICSAHCILENSPIYPPCRYPSHITQTTMCMLYSDLYDFSKKLWTPSSTLALIFTSIFLLYIGSFTLFSDDIRSPLYFYLSFKHHIKRLLVPLVYCLPTHIYEVTFYVHHNIYLSVHNVYIHHIAISIYNVEILQCRNLIFSVPLRFPIT